MSATPSAGALRAAEALEPYLISTQPPFFESEYREIAVIIHRETQADTAALVGLMEKVATMLEELPEDTMESFMAKSIREALAKHGEGAL